jgi:rare lipoprotein A (peptidoglycan hydrolase)
MLRSGLRFSGTAHGLAGQTVEIERSGHQTGWHWAPTVQAAVASDGSFSATWATNHIGRFAVRAVAGAGSAARTATATPSMTVTVYRPSRASYYGPGLYGRRTACGRKLTKTTIGLANRTLPCGESVALYYGGRTMVVPVIDRGPYANGADWDLTAATARALGVSGVAEIGAVSLPSQP